MPRMARDAFDASFFHVIVQGMNKEFIFKEERFINQYLKLIRKHIDNYNVEIIAYCIMGNHAHFLLKTDSIEEISKVMHKTNGMYAKYYNFINERVGYVFRDRFLSEPIMNQRYFIQCIKYIHLNPVKANIVQKCEDYKYSSFNYYLQHKKDILDKGNITHEEYEDICNSNHYTRNFLDVDRDIKGEIEIAVREFLYKEKLELKSIFLDRKVFKNLIYYLKVEWKINYSEVCKYFEISRNLIRNL